MGVPALRTHHRGARQWRGLIRYIDGVLTEPAVAAAPLVLRSAARLLAATALAVFPHTADLASTTFCDVAGVRSLVRARNRATAMNAEIRLSVRPGPVRRVLTLVNLSDPFLIYASTSEATAVHAAGPLN